MRVLLDATAIPPDLGGVGRYIVELAPRLVGQGVDVVVVCQRAAREEFAGRLEGATVFAAPAWAAHRALRLVWEQVGLPRLVRRLRADVLHSPHYTMPLFGRRIGGAARVVTLHDATFFSAPQVHGRLKRVFFRTWTRLVVARADALVVPSIATRDAVLAHAGGRPAEFHVAYHGVDRTTFRPAGEAEQARVAARLGVQPGRYVAFLGTLEPRKNVPALVRGWASTVAGDDDPPPLVLAGGPGWDNEVEPAVAAVPPPLRVVRPGYLPVGDLAGFLAGARVVAYPSLGEGFGLPVLEALACGAAVLTSRELALPEVGGDAVAYTGTSDREIGDALARLLADDDEHARLAAAGPERAAAFTWEASAAVHLTAYEAALAACSPQRASSSPSR